MTDEVRTSMGMTFVAFRTPDNARLLLPGVEPQMEADFDDLPTVPVEDLESGALDALASQWLVHLYARCNKASPWGIVG